MINLFTLLKVVSQFGNRKGEVAWSTLIRYLIIIAVGLAILILIILGMIKGGIFEFGGKLFDFLG